MKQKKLRSALLSIFAAAFTIAALGGITVLAEGESGEETNARYKLTPADYEIVNTGYIDISCKFEYLELGKIAGTDKVATGISFSTSAGTLSDGKGHEIPYLLGDSGHNGTFENLVDLAVYDSVDDTFKTTIYIDTNTFWASYPGTYEGKLNLAARWTTGSGSVETETHSIALTMNVPTKVVASGTCGTDASWKLYNDERLVISGTGAMKDYGSSTDTSPWSGVAYRSLIKKVVIESGITHIGNYSFYFCQDIESASIPDTVTTIGIDAFGHCENLSSVNIPNSVQIIGNYAFWRCRHLSSISIPNSVTTIGEYAFSECAFLTITLPDSVTNIGESAFSSCGNLYKAVLPSTITTIPENMFSGCRNLSQFTFPASVTDIGEDAFSACGFTTLSLPSTVTSIGESAFSNNDNLKTLIIPSSITVISSHAFTGCEVLESVTIPSSVTKIDNNAFSWCEKLTSIEIPSSVTSIGNFAFNRSGLTNIDIPLGVTTLGEGAFTDCYDLETVTLPDSITTIGERCFSNCRKLGSVVIPSGVTSIEKQTFSGSAITSVTIPDTVTTIGKSAFYYCFNLTDIVLPKNLTTIGEDAFNSCRFTSIDIPSKVTRIENNAFSGCEKVTELHCYADPERLVWIDYDSNAFARPSGSHKTICYVPQNTLRGYMSDKFASVNVTFTEEINMDIGEHLYGYTLSLEGDIGVNFYMKFNDIDALSSNAEMVFTIRDLDGTKTRTQSVKVNSVTPKDGYYIFKCKVNAKEMTSLITAQIVDGNIMSAPYTYTVQQYADYILKNPAKYADEQDLVKAMLNYGAYSQIYFNYNTRKLANSILSDSDKDVSGVTEATLADYEDKLTEADTRFENPVSHMSAYYANLSLESETTLNIKFKGVPAGTVFKLGDKVLDVDIKSNDLTTVSITGISAKELNSYFTITIIFSNSQEYSFTYSPMNYCYNVLHRNRSDELSNTVRALYLYNLAADSYKAN
ncbi:leucine-rich repeat domain-containing protein [Butyrivibrio sp. AE2032]|uniref:leucine-rich repeat domain-containing protein n=1 Tax=Butyrivibrio sp. AE2032 TaxID=1458463 RepID=UPI00068F1A03|nr:leucine-rich repeat domain-containing protein [Butyrivibrio sp. AE2032]